MSRILIVDDNQLNLELAQDVLVMGGFEVETAESGEKGIAKALKTPPDLVLMDLRMPGMDGLEAMHTLHDDPVTRHIPVAVLTASVMLGERDRLLKEGFNAYLQKPLDPSTFADDVAAILD